MTTSFTSKFTALSLAALVTLSVLTGLTSLAQTERADAEQMAQAQATRPA